MERVSRLIRDTTRDEGYAEARSFNGRHLDSKLHPRSLARLRRNAKTSHRILHRRTDDRTRTLGDTRIGDRHTTLRHGLPFPLPRSALDCEWSHCSARI